MNGVPERASSERALRQQEYQSVQAEDPEAGAATRASEVALTQEKQSSASSSSTVPVCRACTSTRTECLWKEGQRQGEEKREKSVADSGSQFVVSLGVASSTI